LLAALAARILSVKSASIIAGIVACGWYMLCGCTAVHAARACQTDTLGAPARGSGHQQRRAPGRAERAGRGRRAGCRALARRVHLCDLPVTSDPRSPARAPGRAGGRALCGGVREVRGHAVGRHGPGHLHHGPGRRCQAHLVQPGAPRAPRAPTLHWARRLTSHGAAPSLHPQPVAPPLLTCLRRAARRTNLTSGMHTEREHVPGAPSHSLNPVFDLRQTLRRCVRRTCGCRRAPCL